MTTTFTKPVNNASSTVAQAYTAGAGTLTLADASSFGSTFPIRVSTFRGTTPLSILQVTGITGNVLTVNAAIEGTTDVALVVGDLVECVLSAGYFTDAYTAINALESNPGGTVTSVALAVPAGLSVSGSPITGSGTITVTTALSGLVKGTGTGFTTATAGTDYLTPTGNGSGLVNLDASKITTNTVPTARLGTGTASATTYLRGDQTWATVPQGTVTSVAMSVPSGFSVSGSPITGSGTLSVTTALSGILKGTGTGFTTAVAGTDFLPPSGDGSNLTNVVHVTGTETITGAKTFTGSTTINNVTIPSAGMSIARTGTGTVAGNSWAMAIQNSAASDTLQFGMSSSNYTTGGPLTWVGNSQGFLYFPTANGFKIGTGTGTSVATFSGTGVSFDVPITGNGSGLTNLDATDLTGTVPTARLGSGTADNTSYLRGDQSWVTPTANRDFTFILAASTPATTGVNKTNQLTVPSNGTILKAYINAKTAPTGSAFIVDINVNGTSVWNTTQANRLQLAASGTTGSQTSFDTTNLSAGDVLSIDIDQVGSTVAGQDITVQLVTRLT